MACQFSSVRYSRVHPFFGVNVKLSFILVFLVFCARPVLADSDFLVLGDWGEGDASQRKVARGMKQSCDDKACDFVITVGDNFYPIGVKGVNDPQWQRKFVDVYSGLGIDFYPSLGNHDYSGNESAQIEYSTYGDHWKLPARYHRFTHGEADFFVIDTERFDDEQQSWLNDGLARSGATWQIVYGHRPILSYGQHGSDNNIRKKLLPLLQGRADFYIAGHDHDKQMLRDPGSNLKLAVCGTGHETRPVGKGPETLFSAATLGFCRMKLEATMATFDFLDSEAGLEYRFQLNK